MRKRRRRPARSHRRSGRGPGARRFDDWLEMAYNMSMSKSEYGLDLLLLGDDSSQRDYNLHGPDLAFLGNTHLRDQVLDAADRSKTADSPALLEALTGQEAGPVEAAQILRTSYGIPEWIFPLVIQVSPASTNKNLLKAYLSYIQADTDMEALSRHLMAARLKGVRIYLSRAEPAMRHASEMSEALKIGDKRKIQEILECTKREVYLPDRPRNAKLLTEVVIEAASYKTSQAITSDLCQELSGLSPAAKVRTEIRIFERAVSRARR